MKKKKINFKKKNVTNTVTLRNMIINLSNFSVDINIPKYTNL